MYLLKVVLWGGLMVQCLSTIENRKGADKIHTTTTSAQHHTGSRNLRICTCYPMNTYKHTCPLHTESSENLVCTLPHIPYTLFYTLYQTPNAKRYRDPPLSQWKGLKRAPPFQHAPSKTYNWDQVKSPLYFPHHMTRPVTHPVHDSGTCGGSGCG
ncbi:hypothetical protein FA15DRAFT_74035 [Coprinopsis marcescibilis]|uniref:Secreted protein n=1 Tax=Coprinopsis marcescibilis TaxID=230819 RepID=A0A5C3L628_COPMA|nr:hypothetical protein FA15DRAFT_74035 [Coprinopsis marcescibilis]